MAGVLLSSIGSGQSITRSGRYKVFPIVGTAVVAVGMLLLSRLAPETSEPVAWLSMFVLGAGLGLVMQVLVLAVQNAVAPSELGTATSAVTFFRSIGGSIGVSVFSAVFNARFADDLATALPPGAVAQLGGTGNITPALVARLPAPVRAGLVQAFSDALDTVFLAAVPFAVVAFALSWALPEVPLRSRAAPVDGVAESFGMVRSAAAEVLEEAQARIAAARAALLRLDELTVDSDVPAEQVAALRALFESRVVRIAATAERARSSAAAGTRPAAFWRVAAELLAVERRALSDRFRVATPTSGVAVRADLDLAAEQDELLGVAVPGRDGPRAAGA
jgi:hypothetical protein